MQRCEGQRACKRHCLPPDGRQRVGSPVDVFVSGTIGVVCCIALVGMLRQAAACVAQLVMPAGAAWPSSAQREGLPSGGDGSSSGSSNGGGSSRTACWRSEGLPDLIGTRDTSGQRFNLSRHRSTLSPLQAPQPQQFCKKARHQKSIHIRAHPIAFTFFSYGQKVVILPHGPTPMLKIARDSGALALM